VTAAAAISADPITYVPPPPHRNRRGSWRVERANAAKIRPATGGISTCTSRSTASYAALSSPLPDEVTRTPSSMMLAWIENLVMLSHVL
jgi:hypothetical protein